MFTALAEGLGISMLLPLLQNLNNIETLGSENSESFLATIQWMGFKTASEILIAIVIIFILKGFIGFTVGFYVANMNAKLLSELKTKLFNGYSMMSFSYFTKRDTGYFINVINEQINNFLYAFREYIYLLSNILMGISYISFALIIAWRFGIMAIVAGGLMLVMFKKLNRYVHQLSRKSTTESAFLTKILIQILQSFKYITATYSLDYLKGVVINSIQRLTEQQLRQQVAGAFTSSIREPASVVLIVAIILVQINFLHEPIAPILVSILLFYRGLNAIFNIQVSWQSTLNYIGSVETVNNEFINLKNNLELNGSKKLEPFQNHIDLKNISFSYNSNSDNVLSNISFSIPAKTMVAFIGESGAGKSTLIDMITLLLKPDSGSILIDGISSIDIELASWRKQIGYVSQDVVIFDDTIANNICLWNGDINTSSTVLRNVKKAAKQAYIDRYIESLPQGYDTLVGDRGVLLSGGQKQRLFIARELFKKPAVLILDEATSALDSESEAYIRQSIESLRGHLTVIIIAHRLSTIQDVDQVVVIEKGQIIEYGSYIDLRSRMDSKLNIMISKQLI